MYCPTYAKKSCKPGTTPGLRTGSGKHRDVLAAGGLPVSELGAFDVPLSRATNDASGRTAKETADGAIRRTSPQWVSADCGIAAPGRLASGQAAHSAVTASGGSACAADQAQDRAAWGFDRVAHHGDTPEPCMDVGFHR